VADYYTEVGQYPPVSLRLPSLRLFYIKVPKKSWSIAETTYPKKAIRLQPYLPPVWSWLSLRLRSSSFLAGLGKLALSREALVVGEILGGGDEGGTIRADRTGRDGRCGLPGLRGWRGLRLSCS
jgi:hypothetical protein